ncbi:MAG: cation diffusion facilitator family transporter [Bacteroidetes bacterium]|nr:cation diffusion facilitator family transporter [Rhodothermia bacterium]MCS7154674.1 cation diffusion facilitator family transporter [Bacteroidota bacterium]MCX7906391.1 cation diffusion facilitator family transporter [Bacteroidota bacterium]MDW8137467.1 cation diffusion facilitator family transporter [Bacteroidota bacterium]MDW8285579.1 cation diffusion facilitator family transporter [Bacteroidota bacterium]
MLDVPNRLRAARWSLAVGVVLLGLKFSAYLLTGSAAVLSDALESIINVVAALLALVAVHLAARPPDATHPYGHGKIEFFSAGFEGSLIMLAGGAIGYKAVEALLAGIPPQRLEAGTALVAGAGLVNAALGGYLIHTGRRTRSATLRASGHHVLSDAYTSAGVVMGLLLVRWTGLWWLDPAVAIAVGLHILRAGYKLVREAVAGLMDEADPSILERVAQILEQGRQPGWIAPHRLRLWRSGATLHVDFHLILPYYWTLQQSHEAEHAIHELFRARCPEPTDVIVHTEPCWPACCALCAIDSCPVRQAPLKRLLPWNGDLLRAPLKAQLGAVEAQTELEYEA